MINNLRAYIIHSFEEITRLFSGFLQFTGYMGECGVRGGYVELTNLDEQVKQMLVKRLTMLLTPVHGQVSKITLRIIQFILFNHIRFYFMWSLYHQ